MNNLNLSCRLVRNGTVGVSARRCIHLARNALSGSSKPEGAKSGSGSTVVACSGLVWFTRMICARRLRTGCGSRALTGSLSCPSPGKHHKRFHRRAGVVAAAWAETASVSSRPALPGTLWKRPLKGFRRDMLGLGPDMGRTLSQIAIVNARSGPAGHSRMTWIPAAMITTKTLTLVKPIRNPASRRRKAQPQATTIRCYIATLNNKHLVPDRPVP